MNEGKQEGMKGENNIKSKDEYCTNIYLDKIK